MQSDALQTAPAMNMPISYGPEDIPNYSARWRQVYARPRAGQAMLNALISGVEDPKALARLA
jgi:hypothetical protein